MLNVNLPFFAELAITLFSSFLAFTCAENNLSLRDKEGVEYEYDGGGKFDAGFSPAKIDKFVQNEIETSPLDLVVVIDNSPSMEDYQANLGSKLDNLIGEISGFDWRIFVITTDMEERGLISHNDPDKEEKFSSAIQAGIDGSDYELGLSAALRALKSPTPWLRNDSSIAVLIVGDEDQCSDEGCRNGTDAQAGDRLLETLSKERSLKTTARIFGIINQPHDKRCEYAVQSDRFEESITRTGGSWASICDDDYTETLSEISRNISQSLRSSFKLTHTPRNPEHAKVFINGTQQDDGWHIQGDSLYVSLPPDPSATIEVHYNY